MFDMQAVHELYEVTEGAAWGRGSGRGARVVVIGCRLQGAKLEQDLQRCLARAATVAALLTEQTPHLDVR